MSTALEPGGLDFLANLFEEGFLSKGALHRPKRRLRNPAPGCLSQGALHRPKRPLRNPAPGFLSPGFLSKGALHRPKCFIVRKGHSEIQNPAGVAVPRPHLRNQESLAQLLECGGGFLPRASNKLAKKFGKNPGGLNFLAANAVATCLILESQPSISCATISSTVLALYLFVTPQLEVLCF